MEVLFEFKGSRRHITVASSEAITEIVAQELQRLGKRRARVYTADADLSEVDGRAYLLQLWYPQWESYVDVRDAREVEDGDRLAVTPKPKPPSVLKRLCCCCCTSGEDTQPGALKSRKRQHGRGKQSKYWPEEIRELEYHFAVHSELGSEWDLSSLSSALRQETVENGQVQVGDGVGSIELEDQPMTPVATFVRDSTGCASWRLVPSVCRKEEGGQRVGEGGEGGEGERTEREEGGGEGESGEGVEEEGKGEGGERVEGGGEGEIEEGQGGEGGGEGEEGGGEGGEGGGEGEEGVGEGEEGGGEGEEGVGEGEKGVGEGGEGGGDGEVGERREEEEEEEEGFRKRRSGTELSYESSD